MSIQPLNSLQEPKNKRALNNSKPNQNQVAFKGAGDLTIRAVVGTMDFIEKGGYATSFIIQDGLGFIIPRVVTGLFRGSTYKEDENGNPILDKNGNKIREYNWANARKEAVREIITGPSAFLIPLGSLALINKFFGRANNVKLNYIDGFKNKFIDFAKQNLYTIKNGNPNDIKNSFYKANFKDVIERSINDNLPNSEKLTAEEVDKLAETYANKQIAIEKIKADKSLNKTERANKLTKLGSVVDDYMELRKGRIGGDVDEMAISLSSSNGKVKSGSIGEFIGALSDYYDDAVKTTKASIKDNVSTSNIEKLIDNFTKRRMGSRFLTNIGIFTLVGLFYTQIPKLYNMGIKGNPALKGTAADKVEKEVPTTSAEQSNQQNKLNDKQSTSNTTDKNTSFTGISTMLEKTGEKVFNGKHSKSISDIFELNGPVISGKAMALLLYGFCIPPRLINANDKYEYREVVVRDFTAFTALLFGAKALARLFSDGFTKLTGLALNKKDMEGRAWWQKTLDYLNPSDTRHSVLSSKQLISKYTNIEKYKDGINGFVEYIEKSNGNIKKALTHDKKILAAAEEIVKKYTGKNYKDASVTEIKSALNKAKIENGDLIKNLYKLFDTNNGLLKHARAYNSTFGFLSTILLVPGLIVWLTTVCKRMTERSTQKDFAKMDSKQPEANEIQNNTQNSVKMTDINRLRNDKLSMAGFLNK